MVRVPDWAFEAAGQEMRGMGQDTASYHPGLYLTPAQVGTYYEQDLWFPIHSILQIITLKSEMVWLKSL